MKLLVLAVGAGALAGLMLASILLGYHRFTLPQLLDSIYRFDGSREHLLLRTVRLPSAFIAVTVGASLAVAGALMQVLTRNPLASPSVLGINQGAVLFIVALLTFTRYDLGLDRMIWIAFAGAGCTAAFVFLLGGVGGGFGSRHSIRLTLAGASVAALASSFTSGMMLIDNTSMNEALFWLLGSVTGRNMEQFLDIAPYMALGGLLAFGLSKSLNVMAMDDEIAKGLGQWLLAAKGATVIAIVLLAGSAVAIAGPIAFVGLIVPHICRYLVGVNHYWLLPYSALAGAMLLVSADLGSRFLLMPKEVPVGVTTAFIGVPFLMYLARRRNYE